MSLWFGNRPTRAIAKAHAEGLSIRTIAKVTGLSSSRVYQLSHSDETHHIVPVINTIVTL